MKQNQTYSWKTVILTAVCALVTTGCSDSDSVIPRTNTGAPVSAASCGPGSSPETGLQGQVPLEDRQGGRNLDGYSCNLRLVGQYQGQGAAVVSPSTRNCAYMSTGFFGQLLNPSPGTQVVDVSDPANPALVTNLISPAMLQGTWESLKVHEGRQLLGGVAVGAETSIGFFDLYDISGECTQPVHTNSLGGTPLELPNNVLGHEGNWSPDGMTYWSTGNATGSITAIDVSDPASPSILFTGLSGFPANHGVELNETGDRLYLTTCFPGGIVILDTSSIQNREPVPMLTQIAQLSWNPRSCGQHALPVSYNGIPYLIAPDEFAAEGIRFINISDETAPQVVNHLQLEIQLPENIDTRITDTAGNGLFGYEAHYCDVDRRDNPTTMACGYFQSGIRVFDIRNPLAPREIAYFNPPAQTGNGANLQGSLHAWGGGSGPVISDQNASGSDDLVLGPYWFEYLNGFPDLLTSGTEAPHGNLSADWCSSPPRFVGNRLWVTCMDNGFMVLEFTNGVYPIQ